MTDTKLRTSQSELGMVYPGKVETRDDLKYRQRRADALFPGYNNTERVGAYSMAARKPYDIDRYINPNPYAPDRGDVFSVNRKTELPIPSRREHMKLTSPYYMLQGSVYRPGYTRNLGSRTELVTP